MRRTRFLGALCSALLLAGVGACGPDSSPTAVSFDQVMALAEDESGPDDTFVRVCKIAQEANEGNPDDGTLGEWFDFTVTATGGQVLLAEAQAQAVTLDNYTPEVDCPRVWTNGVPLDDLSLVTVTEEDRPGYAIESAFSYYPIYDGGSFGSAQLEGSSLTVVPQNGVYVYFKNVATDDPPPPPPPPTAGGGEGCTPGYWRQAHHYDDWVGYAPGDSYLDVFGVGPDIPLGDAVKMGGGGFNALVRTSVASLLNAASPDVSFDLTVAEVIQLVQDAYASGEPEAIKDDLDELNNQGCTLGNGDDDEDDEDKGKKKKGKKDKDDDDKGKKDKKDKDDDDKGKKKDKKDKDDDDKGKKKDKKGKKGGPPWGGVL